MRILLEYRGQGKWSKRKSTVDNDRYIKTIPTVEVMIMETQIIEIEKGFETSQEKFVGLCQKLKSASWSALTHSQVEKCLQAEGMELLRQMYQDHLDLRSLRESRAVVVKGADGQARKPQGRRTRQLESLFGTVLVERIGYGQSGCGRIYPLDGELNLPPVKYSYGLQSLVALEAARGSYDETQQAIHRYSGGHVPKRQAEELMQQAVCDFEAFYEQTVPAPVEDASASLLILSLDAKGIVMRPQDLRKTTRKAAQKLSKRLSKGEKRNRKRMATAATVYTQAPHPQTPSQVAKGLHPQDEKSPRPQPLGKRVWASVEKEVESVVTEMFEEALGHDPFHHKQWVALVDGNKTQIRLLEATARRFQVKLTIVVDVIHVLEYLWKAAYAFYEEGSQAAQDWVSEKLLRILQGQSSRVAGALRRKATRAELSREARGSVDACAQYLLNHKRYLRYPLFLGAGYPIATGVIEGVCRHLIKDRMDRTGARWSLKGAEAILKLRSLLSSGDFEDYWEFHENQEKRRHYAGIQKIFSPPQLFSRKGEKYHEHLRKVSCG